MKHLIYTRKIYIDEGYRVFMSYGPQWQSSQWQSHFKSSVALCLRVFFFFLAGNAIITTISLDTGTH